LLEKKEKTSLEPLFFITYKIISILDIAFLSLGNEHGEAFREQFCRKRHASLGNLLPVHMYRIGLFWEIKATFFPLITEKIGSFTWVPLKKRKAMGIK